MMFPIDFERKLSEGVCRNNRQSFCSYNFEPLFLYAFCVVLQNKTNVPMLQRFLNTHNNAQDRNCVRWEPHFLQGPIFFCRPQNIQLSNDIFLKTEINDDFGL